MGQATFGRFSIDCRSSGLRGSEDCKVRVRSEDLKMAKQEKADGRCDGCGYGQRTT